MKETVNTYDKNGNLVRSVTDDTQTTTREWNGFGQQTSWNDGTTEVLFRYRPDGLRHSKQVLTGSGANGTSFLTIHYWDGQNVIGEAAANGTMKALYYRTGNDLTAQQISDDMSFYLYNAHGDVTERTDSSGNILKRYKYDSFGNIMNPATVGNPVIYVDQSPFGYCGEYLDRETQEIYLRARYYDPASGRFNAEDPLGDTINLYSYCGNDPVNSVDPSGMIPLLSQEDTGTEWFQYKKNVNYDNPAANPAPIWYPSTPTTPTAPQMSQQSEIPWDFTMPRNYVPRTVSNGQKRQTVRDIIAGIKRDVTFSKIILASAIALANGTEISKITADFKNYKLNNQSAQVVIDSTVFSSYKGTLVLKHSVPKTTSCSILNTIFLNSKEKNSDVLSHEWGHSQQEQLLGFPAYAVTVGIPSFVNFLIDPDDYYSFPWERMADILGGVNRAGNTPNSEKIAWLYFIWSMQL